MLRSFPLPLLCLLLGCSSEPREGARETISLEGKALGTTWMVKVRSAKSIDPRDLRDAIVAEIEKIEKILSHWRPDAELYQFNHALTTEPVAVHPHLHNLLQYARRINEESLGAFDVTIAPLVNLWGFGPIEETRGKIPTGEEIENALASMGQDKLELLPKSAIRKIRADLQLDLSAIAKGYAIDQVANKLDELGALHYLIELGGELRAKGNGSKGKGWQVGLEHPQADANATKIHRVITLTDAAVATSGNYRLAFTDPDTGQSYSHLIDPRTGRPVNHDLLAVSVVALTAMEADAWATALLVVGREKGLQLAERENLDALFVERDSSGIKVQTTANFPR